MRRDKEIGRQGDGVKRQGEVVVDLAEQIRMAIQRGEFAPGEHLRESAIISMFGSSRTSAREALRLLVGTGLVAKTPNRSYRVSAFDDRDLYELGTLRLQLEQLAAMLAFGRRSLIEGMTEALEKMRIAVRNGDKGEAFTANHRFHAAIIQSADHRRLSEAYGSIADQIEFAFLTHGRLERDIDHLVGEHELLLDFAKSGDLKGFLLELQRHVQGGLQQATGLVIPDNPVLEKSAGSAPSTPPEDWDRADKALASVEQLGW